MSNGISNAFPFVKFSSVTLLLQYVPNDILLILFVSVIGTVVSYKYLFTRQVNKQSGVIYYNHNVYEGMDVIPLNGSLTSIKGLKPLEYTYGDSSFRIDKTKLFKLDKKCSNIDEAYTSRHTYASYGEEIGISGKNKSMLSYDLGIEEQ